MDEWMDGLTVDEWMDGWLGRWMGGWMVSVCVCVKQCEFVGTKFIGNLKIPFYSLISISLLFLSMCWSYYKTRYIWPNLFSLSLVSKS